METCRPYGRTGSTTGTNGESDTNGFHHNNRNGRYRDRISSSMEEERRPEETLQEYLDRQETLNGNHGHGSSRSTFRSGSELTSDSDYLDERRNSNQSDTDVFLPCTEPENNEQKRILEQKKRELPPGHRSWKRVADYVNGLPIIPEPSAQGGGQNKNVGQAKRQRIWSEGHERRRVFTQSGSLSFAERMIPQKHATSTSSSNFSMLSSLSSQSSSYVLFESGEDFDKTFLALPEEESSLQPVPQQRQQPLLLQQPPSPSPSPPPAEQKKQATIIRQDWNENDQSQLTAKLPLKPKALVKEIAAHGTSSGPPSQAAGSSTIEGSTSQQETHLDPNKDKPLHRRMTNSDLIALATQHRQQHTIHRRRQNLFQMGMSNVSDSSDTDTSGHSYSSIDDLLIARHDPEEILLNLGFGGSQEKDILDRIPSRFLQQQSQARGISTDQFLYQMDELERGCGFSLVGGLRGLGSALRRSSKMSPSPTSSRGPTPPYDKSVKVLLEPQQNEAPKEEAQKKELPKVLPDELNHNVETAVVSEGVSAGTGQKVKGHNRPVEKSHVNGIVLAPLEDSPQGKGQRMDSATGSAALSTDKEQDGHTHKNEMDKLPQKSVVDMHNESTKNEKRNRSAKLMQSVDDTVDKRTDRELQMEKHSPKREFNQEKGSALQPRILQLSSTHPGGVSGRGIQSREDSFEFEELSSEERLEDGSGAIHTGGEPVIDNQGNLSRSDSTQSDSSGFADENVGCSEMEPPKAASDDDITVTSDSKITQTSFDADTIEPLDSSHFRKLHSDSIPTSDRTAVLTMSQESSQGLPSVTSLEDSPFEDAVDLPNVDSQRTRCSSYPVAQGRRVEESGPKTVVEILSSLHTTSKELEKESKQVASGSTRRKHPKLMKMKSVDPEGYGFKGTAVSRGFQTLSVDTVKSLCEWPCEVLHEVDEDVLSQDCLTDGNVCQRAKDDSPVQSVEHSIPKEPCEQQVVEQYHAATEKHCEEVCEGSDAEPSESKVIPICRSQEANERLSLEPSHSTECSSLKSGYRSERKHQGGCDNVETNPAIPLFSDSNISQLSSQVDNVCKATDSLSNESLSENLSSCIKENISRTELQSCDDIDYEKKEGCRIERTLSEINQCEISSQTSSTVTDDVDIPFFKCQWDKKLPFSAYSSSEFEVEDSESKQELDLNEKPEDSISVRHEVEEELIQPVETELVTTSSTVETSARRKVTLDAVSALTDIACYGAASGDTEEPITTQGAVSHDATLPANLSEPSSPCDEQPIIPESTAPIVMSVRNNPSPVAGSAENSETLDAQSSEAQESASEVPQTSEEAASQSPSDSDIDSRMEIIGKKLDDKSDNLDAQSPETKEGVVQVPKLPEDSFPETGSQLLSNCDTDTRIEMISKEEHSKAREELKALLSAQDYPSLLSSSPLSSARSTSHDEAVEDLKLLQRALIRYDRDLEELESWSSKLYQEVGFALSPEERSDLQSLSAVRHKIKDEIKILENNLMEKFQAVVTMDMEHDSNRENTLWSPSLTHVMCQMVDLLKEQTSLRRFLDELHALEHHTTSPSPTWSSGALPKRRNLLSGSTHNGSVDEGDDEHPSEEEPSEGDVDLTSEVMSAGDLTFPRVMTQGELIEELRKAKSDLKKMRVQSKQDVVMAVREVRQSIMSEVRREIHMESQMLQVQMQAKDVEIENLRMMVKELRETSLTMSSLETSFQEWSRGKDS